MGNALLVASVKDRQAVALADAILPFDNLRLREIEAFWRAFYDSATSFALSRSQLRSICCRAVATGISSLQGSNSRIAEYADAAFELFADPFMQRRWQPGARGMHSQQFSASSDSLAAIDALEFLSAIAFIAAIPLDEKIDLLFDSWDMSEDGALDLDEFTISLKSTLSGLVKILQPVGPNLAVRAANSDTVVNEEEIVMLAESTFREITTCGVSLSKEKLPAQEAATITCEQFREFCAKNKRAKELFDLFDVADASPEKRGIEAGDREDSMESTEITLVAKLEKHSESSDSKAVDRSNCTPKQGPPDF
ncbi:hypothetical protein PRNP1_007173 [Phytophthora ramorum]